MKKVFYAALICAVGLSACTVPFKKAKDGSEYKIISTKNGAKLMAGNFMELNTLVKYKDSVLASSLEDGMPQYAMYDTANFPQPFKEIFKNIHVGDSVVVRIPTDTILLKGQAPPFMKKGQYIYQYYSITNAYTTKEQTDSAQKTHIKVAKERYNKKQLTKIEKDLADNKNQIENDSKLIEAYLAKNNIKATKTKWGTYVSIISEGTGPTLTSADIASVNYTGKTFDSSKVFDSNIDPQFKHVQPYDVNLGQVGGVIIGWTDALLQMKKGTKATVYIPSSLAYGKAGREPQIKSNAILVFDMEVINATTEEAKMAEQAIMQQKAQIEQKRLMDSLQKAKPNKK